MRTRMLALIMLLCPALLISGCTAPRVHHGVQEENLESTELGASFEKLAEEYRTSLQSGADSMALTKTYRRKVDKILNNNLITPEQLASFAIWAERKDPWFKSGCDIYRYVFGSSVSRLGRRTTPDSVQSLETLKNTIEKDGRFDGILASEVKEAQGRQAAGGR